MERLSIDGTGAAHSRFWLRLREEGIAAVGIGDRGY